MAPLWAIVEMLELIIDLCSYRGLVAFARNYSDNS